MTLILDNLTLSSADSAPICLNKSTAVTLTAKEGSVNTLSDTEKNNDETYASNLNAENAVIKCKDGSNVVIDGSGTIRITANGKNGIKSGASTEKEGTATLTIKEVTFEINVPVNDAINAEASLAIESGLLSLSAGDDAIHSDYDLQIGTKNGENVPVISISSCYEGIEGANIHIDSGDITVHATDDGINVANGDLKGYAFTLDIAGGKVYIVTEKGDSLEISDASGNVIYSSKAVRSANYVLYSSQSLSDSETYSLLVNGTNVLSTTISDSKNVRGFSMGRPNDGQGGMSSDDRFSGGQGGMTPPEMPNGGWQNRPSNNQNVGGNENANADSKESAFVDVKNKDWFFNAVCLTSAKKD